MKSLVTKKIFFSSSLKIQNYKNFLIIGNLLTKSRIQIPFPVKIVRKENTIYLEKNIITKAEKCLWGTLTAQIKNMLQGLHKKHESKLKFIGVGFKANLKKNLIILRLGFSHKIFCELPKEVQIKKIKKRPVVLSLKSDFLNLVQSTAFRLRNFKKPEPYKGKGILLANEFVKLKEKKNE